MPRSAPPRHEKDRHGYRRRTPARLIGAAALLGLAPFALAACDDNGSTGQTNTTDVPITTVTTGVPSTSTTIAVPTSDAGAPSGLGTQPAQPGGTAEPNSTPGSTAG